MATRSPSEEEKEGCSEGWGTRSHWALLLRCWERLLGTEAEHRLNRGETPSALSLATTIWPRLSLNSPPAARLRPNQELALSSGVLCGLCYLLSGLSGPAHLSILSKGAGDLQQPKTLFQGQGCLILPTRHLWQQQL